jgi:hypothetical protein
MIILEPMNLEGLSGLVLKLTVDGFDALSRQACHVVGLATKIAFRCVIGGRSKGEKADLNLGLGSGPNSGFASAVIPDDDPRFWNHRCRRFWRYVDCSTLLIFHSSRTNRRKIADLGQQVA